MPPQEQLKVILFSFGFKYGSPVDVNYIFDVRFLPNPYWVDELRSRTGKDSAVSDHVLESESGAETLLQLERFFKFLIEENVASQKKVLRIGIGCTGGRHRSVAVTEKIGEIFAATDHNLQIFHRDIEKDGPVV